MHRIPSLIQSLGIAVPALFLIKALAFGGLALFLLASLGLRSAIQSSRSPFSWDSAGQLLSMGVGMQLAAPEAVRIFAPYLA
jgi:hypothetical protein